MEEQSQYLAEIVATVAGELFDQRLDSRDLSEKDALAITTALGKAAWQGLLRGVASHSHIVNEVLAGKLEELRRVVPPDIQLPSILVDTRIVGQEGYGSEPDAWAERYGQGA
jgi:hypothetical protein